MQSGSKPPMNAVRPSTSVYDQTDGWVGDGHEDPAGVSLKTGGRTDGLKPESNGTTPGPDGGGGVAVSNNGES